MAIGLPHLGHFTCFPLNEGGALSFAPQAQLTDVLLAAGAGDFGAAGDGDVGAAGAGLAWGIVSGCEHFGH